MALADELKTRRRVDYPFFLSYRTRWSVSLCISLERHFTFCCIHRSDNDQYVHINNSIYYHLFDSIVNTYLVEYCGLTPPSSPLIGLVVSSYCHFFSPLSFPSMLDLGLRVVKLGKSSVTYEVGVFEEGINTPSAVGGYTHVFVENQSRKSATMDSRIRAGLQRLRSSIPLPQAKL